ncbi:hypothetical protein K6959_04205 [Bacillus aquiflavi]|uniref:hypothetical protein n=1 Tax=Bacillus aquiflavi TaxID=2672567 RepID=UPI001CAA1F0E|nr:hypothetical protein [Bacillus aquiflavi]UAC49107.1 hypothetical protein K6959_04205 [Bacillus aquiflavi]
MGNAKLFILTNEANEKLLKYETTLVDSRRLLHEIKYKLIMKKDKGRKMKSTLVQKCEDMEKMIGTHHREINAPLNELYDLLIEVVYMKKKFHEKEDEFQHVMLQQKQKIQQSDQQIHRLQERKLLYEKQVKSLATALQIKNKAAEIMLKKKQLKTTRAAKSERVRNILPEIQYSTLVQKEEQISLFFMMAGQLLNKLTEENISEKRKETLINKVKKLEKKLNILEKQGDKYKQLINNVNINIKGRWIYVFWKKWNAHF